MVAEPRTHTQGSNNNADQPDGSLLEPSISLGF